MVWLTRGNKGITEIIDIKDSKNRTEETQKDTQVSLQALLLCTDTAGFPLQMFSSRVFGRDQDDPSFYRNPQAREHDVRLLRSAGGKEQNTGDFYSLTSTS